MKTSESQAALNLKAAIRSMYGTQCDPYMDLIVRRITVVITAALFAGADGDMPLCRLNRIFEEVEKHREV